MPVAAKEIQTAAHQMTVLKSLLASMTGRAATWWLAVNELGYFKEEGVDVDVQLFSNYSDGLSALNSGKIDLFVPGLADIIPGFTSGADRRSTHGSGLFSWG